MIKNNLHLNFYKKHAISPVRQKVKKISTLLEYRSSLYRTLGLTTLVIKNSNVLEVAPGAGQNSLFISTRLPKSYTLVEPNPTGIDQIKKEYANLNLIHTKPKLITKRLEDFETSKHYDIVICENWLGRRTYERRLFDKLLDLVEVNGYIITTAISPIGILPNMIRRLMSARLLEKSAHFENQTSTLIKAFASHLKTIKSMTRPPTDWVQDNMINPGYLHICVTIPKIVSELGKQFEVIGSSPVFSQEWRWFKSLHGKQRNFNSHFVSEYYSWCHGFLSYEFIPKKGQTDINKEFELACFEFVEMVTKFEVDLNKNKNISINKIRKHLIKVVKMAEKIYPKDLVEKLEDGVLLSTDVAIDPVKISKSKKFSTLFGRETIYLAIARADKS